MLEKSQITKHLLIVVVALLIVGATSMSSDESRESSKGVQDRFVGAWHLVSLEEPGADGKVHPADCAGMLVFTRDGHISVQVMYREQKPEMQGGPVQYAQGGYEASFGRDATRAPHSFRYPVGGALVRSLIGKDLNRRYEFSGNQLIIQSSN